jgi:hypothetical protein
MQKLFVRRSKKEQLVPLLDRVKPHIVDSLTESNYRTGAKSRDEAIDLAKQQIQRQHLPDIRFLRGDFRDSTDEAEARKNAAILILSERNEALSVFKDAMNNGNAHIRRVSAEGISDIIFTSRDPEEQEDALKTMERAANRGIEEAVNEIESKLLEFGFRRVRCPGIKQIISKIKDLSHQISSSRGLKITSITAGCIVFMFGLVGTGLALLATSYGMHAYQRRSFDSE